MNIGDQHCGWPKRRPAWQRRFGDASEQVRARIATLSADAAAAGTPGPGSTGEWIGCIFPASRTAAASNSQVQPAPPNSWAQRLAERLAYYW
jgi:hypothetical protein